MARESFNIVPYNHDGGGARVARDTGNMGTPEFHTIGENEYQVVCDFLRDVIGDYDHGQIETRESDRAWSAGVEAVIAEIGHWEGAQVTGREIHQAWYQGMLMQGREVPIARRHWATLPDADRELDRHIARVFLQQMAINLDTEVRNRRASTGGADRTMGDDMRQSTGNDFQDFLMQRGKYAPHNKPTPEAQAPEWKQLINDARKERDAAEVRHAKSEELRRTDNATWAAERALWDSGKRQIDAHIDGLKKDLADSDQLRKALDAEIVKLQGTIEDQRAEIVNLQTSLTNERNTRKALELSQEQLRRDSPPIKMTDGLPFDRRDSIGWEFAIEMAQAPAIGGAFMGVAAIGAELASVRMLINNRQQREIDPVGFGKRLATIAGYALQLYREDRKSDPIAASSNWPSLTDAAAERAADEMHESGMDGDGETR